MPFSLLSPQAAALATAVAAVSGAIILAMRFRKSPSPPRPPALPQELKVNPLPTPCISSGFKEKKKNKKRVRFADSVIDATEQDEEEPNKRQNHHHQQKLSRLQINGDGDRSSLEEFD